MLSFMGFRSKHRTKVGWIYCGSIQQPRRCVTN